MRQIKLFEQQGEPRLSRQDAKAVLKEFLSRQHSAAPLPGDELPHSYKAPPRYSKEAIKNRSAR